MPSGRKGRIVNFGPAGGELLSSRRASKLLWPRSVVRRSGPSPRSHRASRWGGVVTQDGGHLGPAAVRVRDVRFGVLPLEVDLRMHPLKWLGRREAGCRGRRQLASCSGGALACVGAAWADRRHPAAGRGEVLEPGRGRSQPAGRRAPCGTRPGTWSATAPTRRGRPCEALARRRLSLARARALASSALLCSAAGSSWGSSWGSSGLPFFSGGAHRAVVREQLLQRAREDVGVVVAEEDLEVASGRQVLAFGAA